jgi:WD40 repeat protein
MLRLVVPGDGTEDTRRRLRYSELPPGSVALAERFEDHRLLVADRDPVTREPTVEVAHESLLRSWPRLRAWLDEDRDSLRRVRHLGESASAWNSSDRPESELYRGTRLDAARDMLELRADQLNQVERDFVVASLDAAAMEQAREHRNRLRLRRGLVATALALVVALVAGSIALLQRSNAQTQADAADVARLVSLAQSLTNSKRDVAMLLAIEASLRDPSPATTGALQSALYSDPTFLRYVRTGTRTAGRVAFAPDGRSIYNNPQDFDAPPVKVDLTTGSTRPVPVSLDADTGVDAFEPLDSRFALLTRIHRSPSGSVPVERVDLSDGHVIDTASVDGDAATLSISPDRTQVAVTTVGRSGTKSRVVVLDASTLEERAAVEQPGPAYAGEGDWYSFAAWIDNERLAVGSPSGRVIVWAPARNAVSLTINDPPIDSSGDAGLVLSTPDGKELVVNGLVNHGLMAYDLSTGSPSWPSAQAAAFAVAIDPVAHLVWAQEAGVGSSRMFAYDLATGARTPRQLDGQHGTVCDARVTPDGKTIVTSSCNEGLLALWSLDGATSVGAPLEGAGWGSSLDMWSPNGAYVALFRVDDPGTVEVLDVRDGTRIPAPGISASAINAPIWRPDGVLQTVDEATNHVIEFDPRTRARRDTGVELPGTDVQSNVAWRDGLSIYGMADGTTNVIDAAHGTVVVSIETDSPGVGGVGFSPDGRRVFAAGQSEAVNVYDIASGAKIDELPTPAANIIENPDGTLMAAAAFNGTIRFYDTSTLHEVGDALSGVSAFPAQLQFTPDGRTLITSGLDNTMHFFDVESRREIGPPLEISGWGAPVSPDSKAFAITTPLGVERLSFDPGQLRAAACRAAGRDLTAAEWAQYIGGTRRPLC